MLNKQLVPNGKIPVFSANVNDPFGYINEMLITDFSVPSVLWGIDGDWMTSYVPAEKPFYPTDHCGVLRCKTGKVNPRYLAHILQREGTKAGFSRAYRASIGRVQGISFNVPSIDKQNVVISQVKSLEKKIDFANEKLKSLEGKIPEILHKYLT